MPDLPEQHRKLSAEDRKNIKCSFCWKSSLEVEQLIAAPNNIYICNECVDRCVEILKAVEEAPTA